MQAMVDQEQVTFILCAAPSDPHVSTQEFQTGLGDIAAALHASNIKYSQRIQMFDSVDVPGYGIGQYTLAYAAIAAPIFSAALVAWLAGRAGRKLKIKVRDIELEANSPEEIDLLIQKALELHAQLASTDKAL
jgi:hypothetical protein